MGYLLAFKLFVFNTSSGGGVNIGDDGGITISQLALQQTATGIIGGTFEVFAICVFATMAVYGAFGVHVFETLLVGTYTSCNSFFN